MIIAHSICLEFECEGRVYQRNWCYYVEGFKVTLFNQDITKFLAEKEVQELMEAYLTEYISNESYEGREIQTIDSSRRLTI